jgi:hypothetical protein
MLARDIAGGIEAGGRAIELAERYGQHEQLCRALNAVGPPWYHNPDGLYGGANPLVRPCNRG